MKPTPQKKRVYDHRLHEYVRKTGDVSVAKQLGVPRSTINGWLHGPELEVVSHEIFDMTDDPLVRQRILKLERRLRIVTAVMILLLTLCRISKNRLDQQRLPEGAGQPVFDKHSRGEITGTPWSPTFFAGIMIGNPGFSGR